MRLPDPFREHRIDADGTTIHAAVGGSGDPVLLLHGYPQSLVMWRDVAPALARDHTVVVPDLRGYGESDKPAPDDANRRYAKREMAADQVAVMRSLGFDRFDLVGHDRGARVAHRLTLDHPDAVSRLAVLDIVPTRHVFTHVDRTSPTATSTGSSSRPAATSRRPCSRARRSSGSGRWSSASSPPA